jgi:hypothetical protein
MASYTDAIAQFNPYVQQLPVELMAKVGMQKQAQYNQGVQKVQNYIDNVAGLDIYRNVDKEHLQSKMNELGSKLRVVAAGDFSNQQLVNSVAGMTGSVIKDPVIQAAVKSTAKIKAGQERRKELEAKGLTDKNNDDLFAYNINQYADNRELADAEGNPIQFNSEYIPYTNITKVLREELTNAGENASIAENILIMEDGKPKKFPITQVNPKTGKAEVVPGKYEYKYADVKTIESLTSNKDAVIGVLDTVFKRGDVKRQLQIDGWANYKDTPIESIVGNLVNEHEEFDSIYEKNMIDLTALSEATDISPEQKAQYEKQILGMSLAKAENEKKFAEAYQSAFKNPEAFKQTLYETEYKNSMMKRFLKEKSETKIEANPGKAQENIERDYLFNVGKENRRIAEKNRDYRLDVHKSNIDDFKFQADYYKDPATGEWRKRPDADKEDDVIDPKTLFDGSVPGDKLPDDHAITRVRQDIDDLFQAKKDVAFGLYAEYLRKVNKNPNMSNTEVLNAIVRFAKTTKETPNDYLFRWASGIQNKYIESGLTPPQSLDLGLSSFNTVSDELDNMNYLSSKAQKEAMQKTNANFPKVRSANGTTVPVDIEDQTSFLLAYGGASNANFRSNPKTNIGKAHQRLVAKYGTNYHQLLSPVLGPDGSKVQKNRVEYTKAWNNELAKYIGVTDATGGSFPMAEAKEIKKSVGLVSAYLNSAEGMRKLGSNTEIETLRTALSDPTSITWKANKPTTSREDWKGSVIITDKNGAIHTIEDINRTDLGKLTGLKFAEYQSTPIENLININTNTRSTNKEGFVEDADAWKGAYFKENKLINPSAKASGYKFRADALAAPGGFQMVYYIKPPTSSKFQLIYGKVYQDESTLEKVYKGATGDMIKNTYLQYLQGLKK